MAGNHTGARQPDPPRRPARGLLLGLCLGCIAGATLPASPALAHLIDEVAESVVIGLETRDRQRFDAQFVLHAERLEAYHTQAAQLGLPQARSDAAFARRLAAGFDFAPCRTAPRSAGPIATPVKGGRFRAFHLVVRCDSPQRALRLVRRDHDRAKTRTTLFLSVRVADEAPRRLLLPPRLPALDVPLVDGAGPAGPAHAEEEAAEPAFRTPTPGDPQRKAALPSAADAVPAWRRALRPPPSSILGLWAEAGARHLAGGWDHLLFLAALTLGAVGLRSLLWTVLAFSLGHLVTMTLAISLAWPPLWPVEVVIGLSVAWAAWVGVERRDGAAWGAMGFGLVHGAAFGTELAALVGGADGLLWPVLSFGVGLDVAQSLWVALTYALWRAAGRGTPPHGGRLHRALAGLIAAAGLAFAARVVWQAL